MSELVRWWQAEMQRVRNLDEFSTAFFKTWAGVDVYVPSAGIEAFQRLREREQIEELMTAGVPERTARQKIRGK